MSEEVWHESLGSVMGRWCHQTPELPTACHSWWEVMQVETPLCRLRAVGLEV